MSDTTLEVGQTPTLTITRMAHGGEGIATGPDGRVVFVRGAYPGDVVEATVTEVKKRFGRADATRIVTAGEYHGEQSCPAAARGAGCCDFGDIDYGREVELKHDILLGQLRRVIDVEKLPDARLIDLTPHRGWRTRVRLGVDGQGRAGTRMLGSHELVTEVACTQVAPALVAGVVGEGARTFTPGAEVIAVLDSEGNRHIVETRKAPRGERVEEYTEVIEGDGEVVERADGVEFRFPPTAFWQAHSAAPDLYTGLVREWVSAVETRRPVAWDLYGGVGLFVPALGDNLGEKSQIVSVDYSAAATASEQAGLRGYDVVRVNKRVDQAVGNLPAPDVIVLDPPRTGAGKKVIELSARAQPATVIHVGCDPATFSRDVAAWDEAGYEITDLAVINAFPGTHHFEVMARLNKKIADN